MQKYTFVFKTDPFVSHFSSNFLDFVPQNCFLIGNIIFVDFFLYFCNVNVNKIFEENKYKIKQKTFLISRDFDKHLPDPLFFAHFLQISRFYALLPPKKDSGCDHFL